MLHSAHRHPPRALSVALIVFLLAAVAATGLIWRLNQHYVTELRAHALNAANDHADALKRSIDRALSATYALAALVRQGKGEIRDFDAIAGDMLPLYPGASSLQLAPRGVVQTIVPLAGNEQAIGHDLLKDPAKTKAAFVARDSGKLTLDGPFNLLQGGMGAVGRLPVFLDDAAGNRYFWGFTSVLIRFPEVLEAADFPGLARRGYAYELARSDPDTGQKLIVATFSSAALIEPVRYTLEMPNTTWTLNVAPLNGWNDPLELSFEAFLGLLLSVLLAYMAKLMVESRAHEKGLEALVAHRTAEVRASEARYRAVAQSANDAIITADSAGNIVGWNHGARILFGYTEAEVTGRSLTLLMPPSYHDRHLTAMRQMMSGGMPRLNGKTIELKGLRKDKREFPLELSLAKWETAEGQFVTGIVRDITARRRTEEALRENEERFRATFEQAAVGIAHTTPDRRYLMVNQKFCDMVGYARDELLAMRTDQLPHPDDRGDYTDMKRLLAGEIDTYSGEKRYLRKDGSILWVNRTVSLARGRDRKPLYFIRVIEDISERKQAAASVARLAAIVGGSNDAIISRGLDRRVLTWNAAAEKMFGYTAGEIVGQLVDCIVPDDRRREAAQMRALQRPGRATQTYDTVRLTKDGRRIDVSVTPSPIKDAYGAVIGMSLMFRDITERKIAEAQLRKLSLAVEQSPESIVITDADARIEYVNDAFVQATGYSRAEMIGQNPRILHSGKTPPATYAAMWDALRQGRPWKGEFCNRRKDGSEYIEFAIVTPLRQSDGSISHYVAVKEDITEKKHLSEELDRHRHHLETLVKARTAELITARRQADAANLAKSDFLANMSHELRTPLNSIIGFSEMLKDGVLGELDAKQRGFATDIFDAGTHLLSLINDILDLSKVEAGMLQLEPGAVDVPALLKASTLVVREKAAAHRIRLDTQIDPALGTMAGDERKLKQIVYNLLSNAVKFTPDGGTVTLRARHCTRDEVAMDPAMPGRLLALPPSNDNEFLAIAVEDTGVGISETHLPNLFEPFVQVDSSSSRRQDGTGLGLALVRRLAQLHGGTVGVASRPGTGSGFWVWLPYRKAMPEGGLAFEETAALSAPGAPLALVIEDDDRIAELIEAQLRAEGFEMMRAATAEEGLVRAAKCRPQLITLDIFLPAMNGWEFLRRLKAEPKLAATAVVIISVSEDLHRGLALGARRVLQKPFVREDLVATLAGLVDAGPEDRIVRVLVVDDNVKAVDLVATVLEAGGYHALRAYSGAEAIEVARRTRPDLVILDLMMPEVSGFDVARALRESEHTARIPIVVLTAKDLTREDHARLNGAVTAILAKASFGANELLAEVRRALPARATN